MCVASNLLGIKLGLLSFWGLWFLLVFSTNLCEGLKVLRLIPWTWKFASHNFQAVVLALAEYEAPSWISKALFSGILLWQLITAFLFGWATVASLEHFSLRWELINAAFAAGLALWAGFMLADELCKQYDPERGHVLFFIAQLSTLVALHLLPS
jgi:hypothetical protein